LNDALLTAMTFTEGDITNGVYAYNVTAVYTGDKESYAQMSNVICNLVPCTTPIELEVALQNNAAILTWEEGAGAEGELQGYNVFRNNVQLNSALITEKTYTDNTIVVGETYSYQVNAEYDHCESELSDEVVVTILPCEEPVELEGVADQATAILTWEAPEEIEGAELLGYIIYRDDEPINEELIDAETLEYHDEGLASGEYTYQVGAVYEHCEALSETVVVVITLGVCDLQKDAYRIFPNPTDNDVNIVGNIIPTSVRIYNITGQLMYETTTCSTNMRLSVTTMPAGIYFIKIDSSNGSTTQKLIVK